MSVPETVRIVASVPGQVRIELRRLYRSQAVKQEIEQRVARHPGIMAARANPLTARVLIVFQPQMSLAPLLADLGFAEQQVAAAAPALKPPPAAPGQPGRLYAAWHVREIDEALAFFGSSAQRGLSIAEAERRLRQGHNLVPQAPPVTSLAILLNQFKSLPIVLLGVSAVVSAVTGGLAEAAAIGAVLVLNGGIGFVTERRAESTVASLSELVDDVVTVVREGAARQIESSQVVPGDILVLSPGTRIAADVRLLDASGLLVDESALTGESFPVAKQVAALAGKAPLAERRNMAYRGTSVSMGNGAGLVVGTGKRTEAGAIQALSSAAERPKTPIQVQLDQLGSQLIKASSAMCVGIFAIGLLRGYDRLAMFKTAISLAIAAVPEGLPAVATTSLARGLRRMRDQNVLIRHLHAVETIGTIQTICLDKTGTLTMNVMSAVAVCTIEGDIDPTTLGPDAAALSADIERLLQVCVLCNEAAAEQSQPASAPNGSATENALLALAGKGGVAPDATRQAFPLLETELRAEGRNFMRTLHRVEAGAGAGAGVSTDADAGGERLVAVKGSPDEVLALCQTVMAAGKVCAMTEEQRARVAAQNQEMAGRQLRVLGFAFARGRGLDAGAALTWIGLVGLADPLRPGVECVIARFHEAGIATIMLTGDQAGTAYNIGKQLHLNNGGDLNIVNSEELDDIAPEQLRAFAAGAHIFSRVTPSHKLRIVQALQQAGQTVAMTGDGINDSPALRAADIGIAMGGGTEVALSAADIALKNDDLGALIDAVGQGRTISANIRKSVHFLLASNLSEILMVAASVTAGLGQALTPLQLLWVNLLTDMLPAIALAAEPADPDVLQQAPRKARQALVGKPEMRRYAREGATLAAGAVGAYALAVMRYGPGARAGTVAFDTLVMGQMLYALFCRSDQHATFFDPGLPPNRRLLLAIASSIGLQVAAHLVPGLRRMLGIAPLGLADVALIAVGAAAPLLINELGKPARHSRAATKAKAERDTRLSIKPSSTPEATLRASAAPLG